MKKKKKIKNSLPKINEVYIIEKQLDCFLILNNNGVRNYLESVILKWLVNRFSGEK